MGIDWQGRGWDRGLRGIAIDGDAIYIAASDELFAYSPDFRLLGSWRNRYLKHCHEICIHERTLFLTSTGFDSILGFDLRPQDVFLGTAREREGRRIRRQSFRPRVQRWPGAFEHAALNNVHCEKGGMHISGLRMGGILAFNGRDLRRWATIPAGAHNARPFRDGVLFNDTAADVVRMVLRDSATSFPGAALSAGAAHPLQPGRLTPGAPGFRARPVRHRRLRRSPAAPRLPRLRCTTFGRTGKRAWRRSRTTSATRFTASRCGRSDGAFSDSQPLSSRPRARLTCAVSFRDSEQKGVQARSLEAAW